MTLYRTLKIQALVIIILALNHTLMAQKNTTKDIIGVYSLPSNNPEGGQSIAVFPDHTFSSVYFGGILKGTWTKKENIVYFTTSSEPQIALYGRKVELLKDTTQLNFSGKFNRRSKVNLNKDTIDAMQYIFNEGANCKDYPYIYKTTKGLEKVSFAISDGTRNEYDNLENFNLFTFKIPEDYNDFLIAHLPPQYSTKSEFRAIYKDQNLYFTNDKPASKRPLESLSKEDISFFKKTSTDKLLPDILKRKDEFFPYINMDNYSKENEDELIALIQPFYIIKPISIVSVKEKEIKVESKSLFTAKCN